MNFRPRLTGEKDLHWAAASLIKVHTRGKTNPPLVSLCGKAGSRALALAQTHPSTYVGFGDFALQST